jgi:hypothetical protein
MDGIDLITLVMLLPWFKILLIGTLVLALIALANVISVLSECAFYLRNIQWNTRDKDDD